MNISYQANGTVSVNTKNQVINLGSEVKIGSYTVPGAGEYDVAAIQCEVTALSRGLAYFIHTEDLTVTLLSVINPEVAKLDDAASTNILVVYVRSDDQPEALKPILKILEPSYVFLLGASPEFRLSLGLPDYEGTTLKVTRSGLPLEGTFLVNPA